jgi:transposase
VEWRRTSKFVTFQQQAGQEVLRVSQWAGIRYMHLTEGVPKKEIARRLGVDVKTVRRAVSSDDPPGKRSSPKRGRRLDLYREEVTELLRAEPRLSAKRIGQLLRPRLDFCLPTRTLREFVAEVRGLCFRPLLHVAGFEELNQFLMEQLTADLDHRRLRDGRTAREALETEREALRPLPAHIPPTCRHRPVVA